MRSSAVPRGLAVLSAVVAATTSLLGIFVPGTYARETAAWAVQAVGQDYANLLVVLILFWSATLAGTASVPALLIRLGCLLYLIYAFAIYAFAVHFNRLFLAYVAVLGLSFYALVTAVVGLDTEGVTTRLREHPHRRGAGAVLVAIGVMFALLWLAEIVPHALAGSTPATLEETALLTNPVHVLDLAFVLPGMIVIGILLRRQHPLGLLWAVPLLVFAVTMGIAILALFALSAARGISVSIPVVVVVAGIVVSSGAYAWLFLRGSGRDRD